MLEESRGGFGGSSGITSPSSLRCQARGLLTIGTIPADREGSLPTLTPSSIPLPPVFESQGLKVTSFLTHPGGPFPIRYLCSGLKPLDQDGGSDKLWEVSL